jgi:hypothetical protein
MNKAVGREYYFCYEKTSKHTALKNILAVIAGNIEIELIIEAIGRKMTTFLLVCMAGLIVCRKYAAMTKMERILQVCKHDALLQMLNAFNIPLHIISGIFTRWIQKHRRTKGWLCLSLHSWRLSVSKKMLVDSHIAIVFLTRFVVESQEYSNTIIPQEC